MTSPPVPTLSAKEHLILELLAGQPDMYGLQLVAGSGGRLKRGTVYVTLGRMEAKGYVASRPEADATAHSGLPRRRYAATPLGVRVLKAWTRVATALVPEPAR